VRALPDGAAARLTLRLGDSQEFERARRAGCTGRFLPETQSVLFFLRIA
jgi:hypothetical protein